jgi:two-component system chemotaxis sensor kinase CheA
LSTVGNAETFKQGFLDEAREILVELEAALLALNEDHADSDHVGRVFRALHTIKGSGSMFGFDKLAAFTHDLETAFDEVRIGRLAVSPELIDLTLAALDQIRVMLEEDAGGAAADSLQCAQILERVRSLAGLPATQAANPSTPAPILPVAEGKEWRIQFSPGPDFMRNGADPVLLLRELSQLGSVSVQANLGSIPPLQEMEPERCYVTWEISLRTAAELESIRDVFIFVEDSCELAIEPAPPSPGSPYASAASVASHAPDLVARAIEDPRAASAGRRVSDKPDSASSLRVPAAKLDQFVDLVGELVTVQARLSEIAARREDPDVLAVSEEVERLTAALRENSMNIRMLPIRGTFERFRRLVHDLARDLDKDVELTIEGADTELDKTVIDQLSDPIMHLVRNSMDHGIEPQAVRAAHGKRTTANIHLSARHSGASVLIAVSDDGGGIDKDAVLNRAIERGLVAADTPLTEAEIFAFIFQPGFSTARRVTDVSGRGVGMDVVRQRVDSLRGAIEVTSKAGEGTCVTLRLPLTLAIIDGLLVTVGQAFFVLPLANTLECIELTRDDIERANGKHMANVRGEIIPYICLRECFHIHSLRPEREQIMIVETEEGRFGFVVDQVLGDCQTVIKNLGRFYRHVQVVSGATILGNGTVALILDPHRLVQMAIRAQSQGARKVQSGTPPSHGTRLIEETSFNAP